MPEDNPVLVLTTQESYLLFCPLLHQHNVRILPSKAQRTKKRIAFAFPLVFDVSAYAECELIEQKKKFQSVVSEKQVRDVVAA